LGNL